jgi:hypothetical protein
MTETVRTFPNVEALVSAYLRSRPEMTALVDDRIVTVNGPESGLVYPRVRVSLVDDVPVGAHPVILSRAIVQVDCWGGTKAQAHTIAQTARGCLDLRAFLGAHELGQVTNVVHGTIRDAPDTTLDPVRPRFLFRSTISNRPAR